MRFLHFVIYLDEVCSYETSLQVYDAMTEKKAASDPRCDALGLEQELFFLDYCVRFLELS